MAEENKDNKENEENKEKKDDSSSSNEPAKEPIPLSQEGASAQLELDVKPKPQDKKTKVHFQNQNLIKSIISTPKEGPGGESASSGSNGGSGATMPPKEDIKAIQARLSSENNQDQTEKPSQEENNDTADMFVFVIMDIIIPIIASKFALDKDDKDYRVDTDRKNKLKKYLAIYLGKMNKKFPIEFMLGMAAVGCCIPVFTKAYAHRKMVTDEREKKKAEDKAKRATVVASNPDKKRRRRSDDDDDTSSGNSGGKGKGPDDGFTPVEVVQ